MTLHPKSPELLPLAAADWATGVRLTMIHEEEKSSITNRPARSTYPKKKPVLASGATPNICWVHAVGMHLPPHARESRSLQTFSQSRRTTQDE
jgi:hypothetical protein